MIIYFNEINNITMNNLNSYFFYDTNNNIYYRFFIYLRV